MSEHSGDRETESHDATEESDTDGGADEGGAADTDGEDHDVAASAETADRDAADTDGEAASSDGADDGVTGLLETLESDTTAHTDLVNPSEVSPDDQLARQVEDTSPGTVAEALAVLGEAVERLDSELDEERERAEDLESRLRRKQADFQNYKKRQKERMAEERERATEDLVERLLDVRDNLARALETDEDVDIRGGIESTLAQFDRELDRENVDRIDPDSGDAVDPGRHEVLATVPSDEPEDAIADIHRSGYEMAGKVLRPAQVTVSDGSGDGDDGGADEGDPASSGTGPPSSESNGQ